MDINEIIITAIGYLVSGILSIFTIIQANKNKTKSETNIALKSTITKLEILAKVSTYCHEAEKLCGGGNGQLKRMYVVLKTQTLANENGIVISQEEIDAEIKKALTAPQAKNTEIRTDIQ